MSTFAGEGSPGSSQTEFGASRLRRGYREGAEGGEHGGAKHDVVADEEQERGDAAGSAFEGEGTNRLKPTPGSAQTDPAARRTPDAGEERTNIMRLKHPRMRQRKMRSASRSTSPDKFTVALGGVSRSAQPSFLPSSSVALSSPRPAPSESEKESIAMLQALS